MMRLALSACVIALTPYTVVSNAAESPYQPRNGHWHETFLLMDASKQVHPFLKSRASYPETCMRSLSETASKVEKTNGFVWTDKNYQILSYTNQPGVADIKQEVTEFKCTFKAWPNSGDKK